MAVRPKEDIMRPINYRTLTQNQRRNLSTLRRQIRYGLWLYGPHASVSAWMDAECPAIEFRDASGFVWSQDVDPGLRSALRLYFRQWDREA